MKLPQVLLRRAKCPQWTAARPIAANLGSLSSNARNAWNVSDSSTLCFTPSPVEMGKRFFSSEAQNNLIDILAREEQEEVDTGNTEMPEDLAELKSNLENDWRIVEDGATVNLFLKDKKVQVSFHCQDTEEDEFAGEEEEVDEEDEPMSPIRFTVTVSKAGKTLTFSCLSDLGEAKIDGVSTTISSPETVHANQGALEKTQYQGPDYFELAEDLQDAFSVFLEDECNVDSNLAAFIAMYTDYKEQTQYVQFLKDTQAIIS